MKQKSKILIVDDNPISLLLLSDMLGETNYEIETADSGQEALNKMASSCPDTVILDVLMPNMNGYQVCEIMRKDEALQRVPVLMVTSMDDEEAKSLGVNAGADDFLIKPVNPEDLNARITTLLKLKIMQRKLDSQRQEIERLKEGR